MNILDFIAEWIAPVVSVGIAAIWLYIVALCFGAAQH